MNKKKNGLPMASTKKRKTKLERLLEGETFITSEKGNSMTPLIQSGQKHVLTPVTDLSEVEVGDIVYARIHGFFYTHLVKSKDSKRGVLIGNNHGGINGWTKKVYGKVIKIFKPGEECTLPTEPKEMKF